MSILGRPASVRRRVLWASLIVALVIAAAPMLLRVTSPAVPDFTAVLSRYAPSEAYLLDRHGEILESLRVNLGVRQLDWIALEAISPALEAAIIDAEDRRFYLHHGIDWRAALSAVKDQLLHHRRRGASTITMQLASLINGERRGGGSWQNIRRKMTQVRIAYALESKWTKAQILEAYLNLVQFRGDLQGSGAASQILAGKSPSGLSASESLVLAALLPDPGAPPERVVERACMRARLAPTSRGCDAIRRTALGLLQRADSAYSPPSLAPQLGAALLKRPGERVTTTLDVNIQRYARDVLQNHLAALAAHNVRDGAVLVVDNLNGDVLAYVGSGGPYSTASQVDGIRARRQAGSTLKPFLYELSLERRYLTASALLEDSPLNLDTGTGTYIPQDYDHDFKGLVSVRTALGSSLNVPAVRALMIVGVEAFRERLNSLGYAGIIRDGEYYGYSLALGSAEVSLWEQAQAYRTLARGGHWSPLRLRQNEPLTADRTPLTSAASFIVSDILSDHAARALTFGLDNHLNTPFWSAAKTGTSKDMRDNWCIGFSSEFTVAVWVGNFEGDAMHDVSGVTGAAPIWHDVMIALHRSVPAAAPTPPPGVVAAQIHFSPAVEPPRHELYLDGTQSDQIVALNSPQKLARIISPANGMTIAVDPDIPRRSQAVPVIAEGVAPGMTIKLNDSVLGSANSTILWTPGSGTHRLVLQDRDGQAVDKIAFTVR